MMSLQQAFPFTTGEPVTQVRVAVIIDMPNMMSALSRSELFLRVHEMDKALTEVVLESLSLPENSKVVFETKRLYFDEHPDRVEDFKYQGFVRFLDSFKNAGFNLIPVPQFRYKRRTRDDGLANTINFREYKSRTDSKINIEVGKILSDSEFEVLIIFSGDSDYEFLIHEAHKTGRKVIMISHPKMVAHILYGIASVIDIKNLSCV